MRAQERERERERGRCRVGNASTFRREGHAMLCHALLPFGCNGSMETETETMSTLTVGR